jgi:hypothetical protein
VPLSTLQVLKRQKRFLHSVKEEPKVLFKDQILAASTKPRSNAMDLVERVSPLSATTEKTKTLPLFSIELLVNKEKSTFSLTMLRKFLLKLDLLVSFQNCRFLFTFYKTMKRQTFGKLD